MMVCVKIMFFCGVILFSLINGYQHFGGTLWCILGVSWRGVCEKLGTSTHEIYLVQAYFWALLVLWADLQERKVHDNISTYCTKITMNILLHTVVTLYLHFIFNNSSFFTKKIEVAFLWLTCILEFSSDEICTWRVWLVNFYHGEKSNWVFFLSNEFSDEDWMLCDVSLAECFTLRKWRWPPELQGRVQCPVLYEFLNTPTLEGVGGWLADQVGSLPYPISVCLTFTGSFASYKIPFFYHTFHDISLWKLWRLHEVL